MLHDKDKQLLIKIYKQLKKIDRTMERFGRNFKIFINDEDYYDSILMSEFQIGEYVKALSDSFINENNQFNWRGIKGFRDIVGHQYANIHPIDAWEGAVCEFPILTDHLEEKYPFLLCFKNDSSINKTLSSVNDAFDPFEE